MRFQCAVLYRADRILPPARGCVRSFGCPPAVTPPRHSGEPAKAIIPENRCRRGRYRDNRGRNGGCAFSRETCLRRGAPIIASPYLLIPCLSKSSSRAESCSPGPPNGIISQETGGGACGCETLLRIPTGHSATSTGSRLGRRIGTSAPSSSPRPIATRTRRLREYNDPRVAESTHVHIATHSL